jgi:hypothetical protein
MTGIRSLSRLELQVKTVAESLAGSGGRDHGLGEPTPCPAGQKGDAVSAGGASGLGHPRRNAGFTRRMRRSRGVFWVGRCPGSPGLRQDVRMNVPLPAVMRHAAGKDAKALSVPF